MMPIDHLKILKQLKAQGGKDRAVADHAYHKSNRDHYGVAVPDREPIVRNLARQHESTALLALAKDLWQTNIFDAMVMAARLLALPEIAPDKKLWATILSFMRDVDGWALEDTLARAAWRCIAADETRLNDLERWTQHKNFWYRRAALVFTLPYAKAGRDPERMLGWAASYADETEWFIQKAIGWWLRDLGSHNPERVVAFLQNHWAQLKYVARHEATRKLSAAHQKKFKPVPRRSISTGR